MFHLGRRLKALYAKSRHERDVLIQNLTWDYPTKGSEEEPDAEWVLREINGYDCANGAPVNSYTELKDDGSTASGCWLYSGVYADGMNQAARREPESHQDEVASNWAWAWPSTRGSSTPVSRRCCD